MGKGADESFPQGQTYLLDQYRKARLQSLWIGMTLLFVDFKKNDTNELPNKTNRLTDTERTNLWLPKGKVERGIN